MARSTQAQRAERVTAAQELLARGTSMAEAAVALSRDFGLSRRQAYRYLEEAQGVVPAPAIAETSVTITLRIPRNIVRELRAYSASSGASSTVPVRLDATRAIAGRSGTTDVPPHRGARQRYWMWSVP